MEEIDSIYSDIIISNHQFYIRYLKCFRYCVISFSCMTSITLHKNPVYWVEGSPGGSDGEASACNTGDPGSILGEQDPLKQEMATHSSTLAWKIPRMEEPGRL